MGRSKLDGAGAYFSRPFPAQKTEATLWKYTHLPKVKKKSWHASFLNFVMRWECRT